MDAIRTPSPPGANPTRNARAVSTVFRIWSRFYDNGIPQRLFYRRVHRRVIALWGPSAGQRVLDVGCGTGLLLLGLAAEGHGLHLTGLDLSEPMLERARRNAAASPPTFVQGSVYEMPFEDGAFDVALNCISCHFYLDQVAAFREVARVLSPGGRFFCAAMAAGNGRALSVGVAVYHPASAIESHLRQVGLDVVRSERLFPAVTIFEARRP